MSARQRTRCRETADQRSVLVVEDEPLNMKMFALTLAKGGYRVLQATDGYHGFVRAHDDRPDIIVMDVRLPGISGLEVSRTLKDSASTRDIPVVIATAFLIDDAELRESGCDGYISKPFVIPKFMELIASLVERPLAAVAAE